MTKFTSVTEAQAALTAATITQTEIDAGEHTADFPNNTYAGRYERRFYGWDVHDRFDWAGPQVGSLGAASPTTTVDLTPVNNRLDALEAQKDSSFKTMNIATLPATSTDIPPEVAALTGADAEEGDWVRAIVDGWALYYSRGATAWTEESREEIPSVPRHWITHPDWNFVKTPGADNSAAYKACLDAMGRILIPDIDVHIGSVYVSEFQSHKLVEGLSKEHSKLIAINGPVGSEWAPSLISSVSQRSWHVKSLTIDGNKDNTNAGAFISESCGISATNQQWDLTVEDVDVINCHRDGITFTANNTVKPNIRAHRTTAKGCTQQGISIGNAAHVYLSHCEGSDNLGQGIVIKRPSTCTLIECDGHRNQFQGIAIVKTSDDMLIMGGRTSKNQWSGLSIADIPFVDGASVKQTHHSFTVNGHVATGNTLHGITIDVADLQVNGRDCFDLEGSEIIGCIGNDNGASGLFFNCAHNAKVIGGSYNDNVNTGIKTSESSAILIDGSTAIRNGQWGIRHTTTLEQIASFTHHEPCKTRNVKLDGNIVGGYAVMTLDNPEASETDVDVSLISAGEVTSVGKTFFVRNTAREAVNINVPSGDSVTGAMSIPAGSKARFEVGTVGPTPNFNTNWISTIVDNPALSTIQTFNAGTNYAIGDLATDPAGYEYKALQAGTLDIMTGYDNAQWQLAAKHKVKYDVSFAVASDGEVDIFARPFDESGVVAEIKLYADTAGCSVNVVVGGIAIRNQVMTTSPDDSFLTDLGSSYTFLPNDKGTAEINTVTGSPVNVGGLIIARVDL